MKKLLFPFAAIVFVSFTAIADNPIKSDSPNPSGTPIAESIPADIHKILKNSCMGCHSKGGKMMAECHLNFSKWESCNSEKKAKKAARMVVMLNKGAMPPKKFRQSHSASIPTKEEISMISKWADSLKK